MTEEDRIQLVAEALQKVNSYSNNLDPNPKRINGLISEVAEAAIAASDATLEVTAEMVEAFECSVETLEGVPSSYDLGMCHVKEHLEAALKVMR